MVGTTPVIGTLSMEQLADTITQDEQLGLEQLTGLAVDPTQTRNLVTTEKYNGDVQLGDLAIVARGADSPGTKILSPNIYISGAKTDVDVYRLPLA